MLVVTLALALAFNLIIIYWKFAKKRYGDAILDTTALVMLATVFGGSSQSLAVATLASVIISTFLYFVPPSSFISDEPDTVDEPVNHISFKEHVHA